jgi:ribosome-binding ATPase
MGFSCGIVGLPNIGKSTIFNALTAAKAASENFPFCTIEPNTGIVPVPDPRINKLAELAGSAKLIPTQMTFVDIAGLIKGAAKGEGLGNQFLGHIRSVDAIAHIVRCFKDEQVIHVDGSVNPIRDIETIETELLLSDLESIQKLKLKYEKNARGGSKDAKIRLDLCDKVEKALGAGIPARKVEDASNHEALVEVTEMLITRKPVLYVCNVDEGDINREPDLSGSEPMDLVAKYASENSAQVVTISGKVEAELAELSKEERLEYLAEYNVSSSGLDKLTLAGYRLLNLITFFTIGPKEAHAWTASQGLKAPQCAGKIHSDFERGFIRAEVISYKDYIECGSENACKEKGKMRVEGKDYIMEDGDIVHFRFNV